MSKKGAFSLSKVFLWGCLCLVGCTGTLDSPDGVKNDRDDGGGRPQTPGVAGGDTPGGVAVACDKGIVSGITPLTRLSTLQYRNTVTDLLTRLGAQSVLPGM